MVRAVVTAAESETDYGTSHAHGRTRLDLTKAADTYNLQIHRPQAHSLQGPEATTIRRKTTRETS
jgi:hypothetical protein